MIIRKRKLGNKDFFYLEHSLRISRRVKKKEKYLGSAIPKEIEKIKKEFFHELFVEKYKKSLDKIKEEFSKEYKNIPETGKQKYIENFMIKFTYNTNRIEGSTLTLKDTAHLLQDGISPNNRPIRDIKEAETHKKVFYEIVNYKKDLKLDVVLYWHKLLLEQTDNEIAGKMRRHEVAIAGTDVKLPYHIELNALLNEFFKWYEKSKDRLHPVELAALVHLKFVSIHPFTDGNGRISRLLMNFVLIKKGHPMLNISYSDRASYYTALERSQKKQEENIFVQYLIKRYMKEYFKYLK